MKMNKKDHVALAERDLPSGDDLVNELLDMGEEMNSLRSKGISADNRAKIAELAELIGVTDSVLKIVTRAAEAESRAKLAAQGFVVAGDGPVAGTRSTAGTTDTRSLGERFTDDAGYAAWVKGGNHRTVLSMEVRALLTSAGGIQFGDSGADGAGLLAPVGTPQFLGRLEPNQRLFMRDVLTVIPTTLSSVPYVAEKNAVTNDDAAGFTAEGAAKPEAVVEFTSQDAPIRKIAVWLPVTTEILADAPTLRGYIDQRLRYMLALREEKGLLNGNGTAPNLRGLLNTSGILSQAGTTGDPIASVGKALGQIETKDGNPSFVVIHPSKYWEIVTSRHANQFDGQSYGNGSPFNAPPAQMWGLPVIRSTGIAIGNGLVGCREGAVILDRQEIQIDVGEQHADYFVTNKVAIRGEERIGLAVHRPDWFCTVALTDPVSA